MTFTDPASGPILQPSDDAECFDSAAVGGPVVEAPKAAGDRWRTLTYLDGISVCRGVRFAKGT